MLVEKMTAEMFPEVYETLLRKLDPQRSRTHWQVPFVDRHWHDETHVGYLLKVRGELVGMMGTLFCERTLNGKIARFCNLHAWYVAPEHRSGSLLLMRPILALKDHTITDFSALPQVATISKRLGFLTLDNHIVVIPPLPWSRDRSVKLSELADEPALAERRLNPVDLQIYRDHQGIGCSHLLVESESEYCYLVSNRIQARWLPYQQVHYISDKHFFAKHHLPIRTHLLRMRTRYIAVGSRLLEGVSVPYSLLTRSHEQLYRPSQSSPPREQIDTLYSELPLMKLCMHFDAIHKIRSTANRFVRRGQPAA
jgi:hypothetical protein